MVRRFRETLICKLGLGVRCMVQIGFRKPSVSEVHFKMHVRRNKGTIPEAGQSSRERLN